MALLKLPDNGQETSIPDEVARNDDLLKQALAIVYPVAGNMEIQRQEKDGQLTVTIIKKAGTKGSWQETLAAAPQEINPAIMLLTELKAQERAGALDYTHLILLQGRVNRAIEEGGAEETKIQTAQKVLRAAIAVPAPFVLVGF